MILFLFNSIVTNELPSHSHDMPGYGYTDAAAGNKSSLYLGANQTYLFYTDNGGSWHNTNIVQQSNVPSSARDTWTIYLGRKMDHYPTTPTGNNESHSHNLCDNTITFNSNK